MDQQHLKHLEILFANSPSVLRNSALILTIRIIGWVLGVVFFIAGIAFLLNENTQNVLTFFGLKNIYNQNDLLIDVSQLKHSLGILFLILSLTFFLIVRLCKMITKRNIFILDLFNWFEDLKEEEKSPKY